MINLNPEQFPVNSRLLVEQEQRAQTGYSGYQEFNKKEEWKIVEYGPSGKHVKVVVDDGISLWVDSDLPNYYLLELLELPKSSDKKEVMLG